MLLHVSRPVRWDPVTRLSFDDELQEIAKGVSSAMILLWNTHVGFRFL